MNWFLVFLGGGIGSMLRYTFARRFNTIHPDLLTFPIGTFFANIASCFILGILIYKQQNSSISENYKLLLATGFCGGFSTFSTFGYEIYQYLQAGHLGTGLSYTALSLVFGLMAVYLGIKTGAII